MDSELNPSPIRVLISVNNFAYFNRMLDLAQRLESSGRFSPALYFHRFSDYHRDSQRRAESAGITVLNPLSPENSSGKRSLRTRVVGRLRSILTSKTNLFFRVLLELFDTLLLMRTMRSLVSRGGFTLLVMPEDCPDYGAPAILRALRGTGVSTVVIGSTGIMAPEVLAKIFMYGSSLTADTQLTRFIRSRWPEWSYRHLGTDVLRSPPETILVQEILGIAMARPWIYHSSTVDALIVDGSVVKDYYAEKDVPTEKYRIAGSAEHDKIFRLMLDAEAHRREIYEELGLPEGKPCILLGLVQEHFIYGAPDCEFKSHHEMVKFIADTTALADRFNIVVSCHPSMDPAKFRFIERPGMRISLRPIAELIAICEVYVNCSSTTMPWAVAAGKPVINYDVYQYGDAIQYVKAYGLITIQRKTEFREQLERLNDDPTYLTFLASKQAESAAAWGKIDGKAVSRIIGVFDDLTKAPGKRQEA